MQLNTSLSGAGRSPAKPTELFIMIII